MKYPVDIYSKHRSENDPELLAAMLVNVSKFSRFVDTFALHAYLMDKFEHFNHRDLELLAVGLSWGLVVAKTAHRGDPGNMQDMRRLLPMAKDDA